MFLRRSFYLISLATNMLEGWDIINLNGGIHSSIWITKTFLYDIREPRYKQIKMGYHILKEDGYWTIKSLEISCPILFSSFFAKLSPSSS